MERRSAGGLNPCNSGSMRGSKHRDARGASNVGRVGCGRRSAVCLLPAAGGRSRVMCAHAEKMRTENASIQEFTARHASQHVLADHSGAMGKLHSITMLPVEALRTVGSIPVSLPSGPATYGLVVEVFSASSLGLVASDAPSDLLRSPSPTVTQRP